MLCLVFPSDGINFGAATWTLSTTAACDEIEQGEVVSYLAVYQNKESYKMRILNLRGGD